MINRFILVLLLPILMLIPACSTSQETTKEETKEETKEADVYVFDKVPETETQTPATETPAPPYFIVQIGAFTTKEKADTFALESKSLIENKMEVKYSNSVNLYVVQIVPFFKTRAEAESVRNKLWQTDGYQDAWIITVQ